MPFFQRALATPIVPAAILSFLPVAAQSGPLDCGRFDPRNKVALARIVTTEARLNFIAGPSKRMPQCPSPESACRLKAFVVAGDEILTDVADGPFLCATFKSAEGMETRGLLPRRAIQLSPPETATTAKWDGEWRRDREAEIVLKSKGDVVSISGSATWGAGDPARVKRGAVNTGELDGEGKPRGRTLAVGYDPDRSDLPAPDAATDGCAARLSLYGRYLVVEDNGGCGGMNVTFSGLYVRVSGQK